MPPAALDRSKTVTSMPSLLRCAAATTPLIPAPIIATRLQGKDMLGILERQYDEVLRDFACCIDPELFT